MLKTQICVTRPQCVKKRILIRSPSTVSFLDGTPEKRNYATQIGQNSRKELLNFNYRVRSRKAVTVADDTLSYRDQRVA